jgi:hypothetical protein
VHTRREKLAISVLEIYKNSKVKKHPADGKRNGKRGVAD